MKSNFTVLDVDDQIRLLKQLLTAEDIDEKRWPARVLAGMIDGWKNRGLGPTQVPAGEAQAFAAGKGGKLYTLYQERLKTLNAADFGDLLLENIRIFRENPDVLRSFQQRFKYILVDEYQDTNVAQYLWLRLLAQAPSATNVKARATSFETSRKARLLRMRGKALTTTFPSTSILTMRASPAQGPLPPRTPKTSAASATTTSRSTAGAARRWTTSCASTTTFPAQRSFASSATTAPPATSSPPPPT